MVTAIDQAKAQIEALGPIALEAQRVLSKPLWEQLALVCKGKTLDEGRDACKRLMAWFDDVEEKHNG